jgi:hypothetical protein
MRDSILSDSPKSEPGEDLLGIAEYAQGLANLIRGAHEPSMPFTIGIYGEWGSGKTTFVRFLRHYLVPEPIACPTAQDSVAFRFVEFSAWPHRTADELWRALILKIAREVYRKEPDLRLMAPVNDVSGLPTGGKNLVILAEVRSVLHFRIFADGKRVVDTDENQLPGKARQIAELKSRVGDLWGAPNLSQIHKDSIITAVTSITSHTQQKDSKTPTIIGRIGEFFQPETEDRAEADSEYEDLVARLDETAYGTISKDAQQGTRLDQVETTMAIVEAALAGLGTLSPLIAWFRSVGGTGLIDKAAQVRREKNKAVRKRVESVQEFKQVLRDLFDTKDSKCRLCVFVDDLDRCMPDVALELLEAIKIILEDFQCVFLLAADEELISQGLRLRYGVPMKDRERPVAVDGEVRPSLRHRSAGAPRGESPGQDADYYDRKGREYFEKIIQLRVPIPPLSPEQTSRYITTQFPDWAPAIDIIQLAVDDNPRRIKQHCNWLSYKHRVVTAI